MTDSAPLWAMSAACRFVVRHLLRFPTMLLNADAVRIPADVALRRGTGGYHVSELAASLAIYGSGIVVLCAAVDTLFTRPFTKWFAKGASLSPSSAKKTSWLLLHSLFNTMIVVVSAKDAALVASNPIDRGFEPAGFWGSSPAALFGVIAIGGFHAHHMLAFREFITPEDIVHHLTNAGAVVVVGALCPWGRFAALSNMAMCGVPGAINYFALWLQKCRPGSVGRMQQKNLNRFCNIVLRYPIQLLALYGLCINVIAGKHPKMNLLTIAGVGFGCLAHTLNALYYADQVVGNYHVELTTEPKANKSAKP